ncbi:MAG: AsmA family protein [Gammaproteobacteria bacterium]|nr:AsmA family protein [Gammaproteobacteria bacterium]
MKKIFRYLIIGVIAAVVFLVTIVAIFIAVFDANAYKQDLTDLVREQTGRELQFHGDVNLTVFPALGMKLGAMSFSNAAGFGALPMIKVKEASISVDLASLIGFAPEIEKLVLRDLEVNLVRNKVGINNWDDLVGDSAVQSSAGGTGASADGDDEGFEIKGTFGGLDLQNIRLHWLDEQVGSEVRINDLDISTGRIEPNKAFPLSLHLDASASGDLDVIFDLKTSIEYLIEQQQLSLTDMALKLNEFEIGGRLQVSNFAKPALRFDLVSQNLDVDALLGTPPAAAPGPQTPASNTTEASEDVQIALPMQTLRDLDIDGNLKITQIKVQNLRLSDLDIKLKAKDGLVALKPIKLNTYGGKVDVAVVVDVKSDTPKYGVSKTLQAVQVGDLLKDYTGEEAISGSLNADVNLTTNGEWLSELKRNSNGTMKLAFLDGALNGFNIRQSIDAAKAKLKGKQPAGTETLKTDFSSLNISGVIRNGVFSSQDLDLQAPLLRVGGAGSANLVDETVDYQVNAKLVGSVEGQQGKTADELAGLEIPVGITGPFSAPKIDVLLDEMLKAKADAKKAQIKAEIERQKNELKQQLEAEKKALAESKKRELEIKMELEKAKAKKKLEDKLKDKLKKLVE